MRKQKVVYIRHSKRKFQEFWNKKHKVFECLSFIQLLVKHKHFNVVILNEQGEDITSQIIGGQ